MPRTPLLAASPGAATPAKMAGLFVGGGGVAGGARVIHGFHSDVVFGQQSRQGDSGSSRQGISLKSRNIKCNSVLRTLDGRLARLILWLAGALV